MLLSSIGLSITARRRKCCMSEKYICIDPFTGHPVPLSWRGVRLILTWVSQLMWSNLCHQSLFSPLVHPWACCGASCKTFAHFAGIWLAIKLAFIVVLNTSDMFCPWITKSCNFSPWACGCDLPSWIGVFWCYQPVLETLTTSVGQQSLSNRPPQTQEYNKHHYPRLLALSVL